MQSKEKPRIPLIMVSGYLGAGKTTFMSSMLNSGIFAGSRLAVLINEFGRLPIDGALLPNGDYHLSEINKGSIFCVCVKTDLIRCLERIANEISPDYLLVEATGIAEPRDISLLMESELLKERYGESVVITIADVLNYPKLSGMLPALPTQVAFADVILLNKTDCADERQTAAVEAMLRQANPVAPIHRTVNGEFLFKPNELLAQSRGKGKGAKPSDQLCQLPPAELENCEFRSEIPLDRIKFYDCLNQHRGRIIRGKGIVDFGTDKKYVEVVNGTVFSKPANFAIPETSARSAMSFVLHGLDPKDFTRQLAKNR